MARAADVDRLEESAVPPDAGDAGHVEDDVHAYECFGEEVAVAHVAPDRADALRLDRRVRTSPEDGDLVAPPMEKQRDMASDESAAAGDQGAHQTRDLAHSARASRLILAL